jgi:hypothetical protein
MLAQLIAFMKTQEWDLDAMQISEILWFVQQVSPLVLATDERGERRETFEPEDLASLLLRDDLEDNKKASPSPQYPITIPQLR